MQKPSHSNPGKITVAAVDAFILDLSSHQSHRDECDCLVESFRARFGNVSKVSDPPETWMVDDGLWFSNSQVANFFWFIGLVDPFGLQPWVFWQCMSQWNMTTVGNLQMTINRWYKPFPHGWFMIVPHYNNLVKQRGPLFQKISRVNRTSWWLWFNVQQCQTTTCWWFMSITIARTC